MNKQNDVFAKKIKHIQQGYKFIYPQREESWAKFVYYIYEQKDGEDIMNDLLYFMKKLTYKNVNYADINKQLNDNFTGEKASLILTGIVLFSKKGPDFYQCTHLYNLNDFYKKIILTDQENKKFEMELLNENYTESKEQ